MKSKTKRRPPRLPRTYSEEQLAGIKQSTMARRLATVERLQTAIDMLKEKKQEAKIAELEAKLAVLESYRTFVEQMRVQMQREEQGRFGNRPPSF